MLHIIDQPDAVPGSVLIHHAEGAHNHAFISLEEKPGFC
jgi:hypothetical protein